MQRPSLVALTACLLIAASAFAQSPAPFVLVAERTGTSPGVASRSEAVTVFHGKALVPTTGTAIMRGALTFVGASDTPAGSRLQPHSGSAEVAWRITDSDRLVGLTLASGLRHGRDGVDVLIGRVRAGSALGTFAGQASAPQPRTR